MKGTTPNERWFELSVILNNLSTTLPKENFSMFEILSSRFFIIKWLYLLKSLVKRALYINPHNKKLMFWMAVNLVCITFICWFPWKIRKNLNFGTVDHIKSVKRALSYWLKGHSKHHHKIRNSRNVRIETALLNSLSWYLRVVCKRLKLSDFFSEMKLSDFYCLFVLCNYTIFSVKTLQNYKIFWKNVHIFQSLFHY